MESSEYNNQILTIIKETPKEQLKQRLSDFIKPHKSLSYKKAKKFLFAESNSINIYGTNNEVVMFSNETDLALSGFNCEHIIPRCLFDSRAPMLGDLHHLYPCVSTINTLRNNFKYAEIHGGNNNIEFNKELEIFECCSITKGNISRSIAYFDLIYDIDVIPKIIDIETLILWNHLDPVDDNEILRNEKIFTIQKNKNPFIVEPKLFKLLYFNILEKDEICMLVDGKEIIIRKD